MADTRIGKIGLTPKGAWVSTDSYEILDVVLSAVEDGGDGCSYTALKPSQGVRPGTDSTIWLKSSQAGQSIYDLAVKYHHFEGTEEEFEAEYQAALQAARDAAAGASAVESQVEEAEAARVAAENARVSAEAARGDAETARQNAETSRATAETARQSAESNRASAETTRQSAETTRESAETTRQSNESARASAELTRTQQFQALKTDMQTAIQNVDAKAAEIAEDIEGYEQNEAGRVSAEQGRVAAETARAQQSASDHTRAESDHTTATSDHQQAGSDHTRAEADHTTASEDHTTAASDHSTAGTDHTRAEQDHTTAESDHGTAESDHTRAESDHAIVQGYDTRLTNVEGEVSQLGQDINNLNENASLSRTTEEEGLFICDKDGNVLIRLDVLDTKRGFGVNLTNAIMSIVKGNAIALQDVLESGFYICNESGQVIVKYEGGRWVFSNRNKTGFYRRTGNLSNGDSWVLTSNSVKNNKRMTFSGTVSSFSSLTFGHGRTGKWNSSWLVIDASNITVYNWNGTQASNVYPHGLTIQNEIQVELIRNHSATATLKLIADGVTFTQEIQWEGSQGDIYVDSASSLSDCSFTWSCNLLEGGIWLFGDSFFSLTAEDRWTSYLFADGFDENLICGYSGGKSKVSITYLENMLSVATPKAVVWCLGMNDGDDGAVNPAWLSAYNELKSICTNENITLILATIPNAESTESTEGGSATTVYHDYKNSIVRNSGYRYIDFATAVGADENGEWYAGMKNNTNVHPTVKGATALYQRAICDAPELMK